MGNDSNYVKIVSILSGLRRKTAVLRSLRGLLLTAGVSFILFGLLIGLTILSWPPPAVRMVIDLLLIMAVGTTAYFSVVRPLFVQGALLPIARLLEKHYGAFQSRLIAALELYDSAKKNRENYSLELIERTIDDAGGFIADIDVEVIIDKKPLKSSAVRTALIMSAAAIGLVINPSLAGRAWELYTRPGADLSRPPEFSLKIDPMGGEFFRNQDLTVNVYAEGRSPRDVDLYFKFDDGGWAWESMKKGEAEEDTSFEYSFKKIQRSVDIYACAGRVKTETVHLEIVDPPRLVNISIRIDYPAYTGLPDAVGEPNDGNVAALKGSVVEFTAAANKPLADAYQLFADSTRKSLKVDSDRMSGSFTVGGGNRYTIMITDEAGRRNPDPIWYDIQALEDYPPSIQIVFPGTDVNLNEEMVLPTRTAISDDYGFGGMNLVWWIVSGGRESAQSKETISIENKNQAEQIMEYRWDINQINPLPGDLIYYYCEVSDNDNVSGPKWAKSRTFVARLPNLDEILAEVEHSQEYQIEELEDVMQDQEELQKQLHEISREMLKASEVDWEKEQAARDVLEKQQNLAERMQNLAQEMDENFQRLDENRLMGEEIAEKMQELQSLMEEIATPELKEAMKKLQEALQKMDPDELREALEKFQMSAEEVLENLDRSLSLLKQLAIEQKLDLLAQLAQKILEDQKEINQKASSARDSSGLADQSGMCQKNSDQFASLKEQFEQLKQMDSEMNIVPDQQESDAAKEINNPEIPQDFSSMSEAMCKGNSGMCQKKGKNLEKNLKKVADALQGALEAMQQQMKQEIAEKLGKAAGYVLYLSERQEGLIDSTIWHDKTEEQIREFAGEQIQIESAARRLAEMISDISKETVFVNINLLRMLGELLNNLMDASRSLENRESSRAIQSETVAMGNMNTLVLMLLKAKDNASSSCSGSGMSEMMKKLGQISGKQSSLNQQTQCQMPVPGMSLSLAQQQSMRQLAAEQDALRRQLEELHDQYGQRGEMLGRLDALAEEMKKVVDDLSEARVGRQTLERQERILSRLLDAQKSVNRREFSLKRMAEQGQDIARKSPMLSEESMKRNGWLSGVVENALKENYPRKYDKLIKAYFKSLQNEGGDLER